VSNKPNKLLFPYQRKWTPGILKSAPQILRAASIWLRKKG